MELRKVDLSNIEQILSLKPREEQTGFVAPNVVSLAEAYATITSGCVAQPFGIYEDGIAVGFVMFGFDTTGDGEEPEIAKGNYCIWRFMIDRAFQGRGLGKKALNLCIDYMKTFPFGRADYCWLSYEPENERAGKLYQKVGFVKTGELCGEETVAALRL